MTAFPDLGWYAVPLLLGLARNVLNCPVFTAHLVSAWCSTGEYSLTPRLAGEGLRKLAEQGFLSEVGSSMKTMALMAEWQATAKGLELLEVALQADMHRPSAPDANDLTTKLWNLLRIRKRLTSDEAAATLVDADDDFEAQKKRIRATLAAWAKHAPEAVKVGGKREAGHLRYVLAKDTGRWPPPTRSGGLPAQFFGELQVPAQFKRKTGHSGVSA